MNVTKLIKKYKHEKSLFVPNYDDLSVTTSTRVIFFNSAQELDDWLESK